jgi:hypothetical protein
MDGHNKSQSLTRDRRGATSPWLIGIASFLAMLVAFRLLDMIGWLPE